MLTRGRARGLDESRHVINSWVRFGSIDATENEPWVFLFEDDPDVFHLHGKVERIPWPEHEGLDIDGWRSLSVCGLVLATGRRKIARSIQLALVEDTRHVCPGCEAES